MLPNLKTAEEKREYAKKLYDLFAKDSRVTGMLGNPAEEGAEPTISTKNWPADKVNAELKRTRGMKARVSTYDRSVETRNERMGWCLYYANKLMNSLEKAADPQTSEEELEKSIRDIGDSMNALGKNGYPPRDTMEKYRDGYNKSKTGTPVMDFFEGMTQTLENVLLTNDMLVEEPDAYTAEQQERYAQDMQKEIDQDENELAELCAQNDISHDQIQTMYENSRKEAAEAKTLMDDTIRKSAELTRQVEGVDAGKVLEDISALEKDEKELTQENERLHREVSALEIGDSRRIKTKLKDFSEKREAIKEEQERLDKRTEESKETIRVATAKRDGYQKQLDELYAKNEYLKATDAIYDWQVEVRDGLKEALNDLREGFRRIGDGNTKINDFLQGKIDGSELGGLQKKAVDTYHKVKEEVTELLQDSTDENELAQIFDQAEKSDMNVGWALLDENSPLQKRMRQAEQEIETLKRNNPALREELEINKQYNKQDDIVKEAEDFLSSREEQQQQIEAEKRTLSEKEQTFKRSFAEIMAKNHAFPKEETLEHFMKASPSGVVNKMNRAAAQKRSERNAVEGKLEKTVSELKSKRELASKIKLSKEIVPQLKTLRADAAVKANREKTLKSLHEKQVDITDKLADRERGLREMKVGNAVNREANKRTLFLKGLRDLRKQVPSKEGEKSGTKNSESYDKMRDDLTDIMDKMKSSDFTAEQRAEAFGKLKESAQKYLEEKDKQWRPFPSQKRLDRLKAAKDIVSFCENSQKLYNETPSLNPDTLHEAALQNPQTNPEKVAQQKFKEQMQPKVNEANNKLQKQVNEPARQEQKQQEQKQVNTNVSALN